MQGMSIMKRRAILSLVTVFFAVVVFYDGFTTAIIKKAYAEEAKQAATTGSAMREFSDAPWWKSDGSWQVPQLRVSESERKALYVTVRDGTRIAIYVFLPKERGETEKLPTVLIMTPYISVIEPRSALIDRMMGPLVKPPGISAYGYATVKMDARGSGASYGVRHSIFMPDLVRDASDVVDWIIRQPWSNGKVGATGISAVGLTSIWLATAKHQAVKAIAPRFTAFDVFYDVHPGGLVANRFVRDIDRKMRLMDSNRLWKAPESALARAFMWFRVKGVQPVDEDPDGLMLAEAVQQHSRNEMFSADIGSVEYRDDQLPSSSLKATLDTQSPFSHVDQLMVSGIPIYAFAGWYDAAFGRSMIHLHKNVPTPGSKLTIGPWSHGGGFYCSPVIDEPRKTDFDQTAELVRFFDYHLKGIDNGIASEPPIHYFTIGEERWKSTDVWPLPDIQMLRYYFAPNQSLSVKAFQTEETDVYKVDFEAGTGVNSRFGKHLTGNSSERYPERHHGGDKLLIYTSAPLENEAEITGHSIITLFVQSTASDGAFFVYLEDVGPDGTVFSVTEGILRARHRRTSPDPPPYWRTGPNRTFNRADALPLVPGEVTELVFDLLPVSYHFEKGHAIRVALSGADKDNFPLIPEDGSPTLQFYHGGRYASHIDLPVVSPGAMIRNGKDVQ